MEFLPIEKNGAKVYAGFWKRFGAAIVDMLVFIPFMVIFHYLESTSARLSIIFPAAAVDERPDMKWAWDTTQGNGWRLVIIVGILPMVTGWIINYPAASRRGIGSRF